MSPLIVAKVKPQNGTCFIVTGYSKEFDKPSELISLAAGDPLVGLRGLRADALAKGDEFPQAVFDEIRAANLVVVVCISDPKTGQVSANVMYELGLASSLRKPMLILTTEKDRQKIPSDLRHVTHKTCEWSELNEWNEGYKKGLAFDMGKVLQAAGPLTDLRFPDTYSEQSEIPTSAIWRGLRKILELTRAVHQDLLPAHRTILSLCESAHVLFSVPGKDTTSFIITWKRYRHQQAGPLTAPLAELVNAYTDFLQRFSEFLDPGAQATKSLEMQDGFKVQEFFDAVKHEVEDLSKVHQSVDAELNDLQGPSWKERQGGVFNDCIKIPAMLDILMNDLYRLLWNVLGVVARNVEERISTKRAAAWSSH
jgi:hypothetical protein